LGVRGGLAGALEVGTAHRHSMIARRPCVRCSMRWWRGTSKNLTLVHRTRMPSTQERSQIKGLKHRPESCFRWMLAGAAYVLAKEGEISVKSLPRPPPPAVAGLPSPLRYRTYMALPHSIESEQRKPKHSAPDALAVLAYIVLGISLTVLAWLASVIVLDWY
jgi:hypothetical protein